MKNKREQTTGIEPASSAWEADILPMNYICVIELLYQPQTVFAREFLEKFIIL